LVIVKEPPNLDSGKPESENDCASLGEVVVYQPERTAANLFLGYPNRIPNGEGNLNAGVLAKSGFRHTLPGRPPGVLPDCIYEEIMASVGVITLGKNPGHCLRGIFVFVLIALGWAGPSAGAKEPSLNVIELYDGASGAAYIQLADVVFNGKAQLRSCAGSESGPIDKSAYNKFAKLVPAPGGVLERGNDGVMRYGAGDGPATCVVPENIKFEHNATFTPDAMADSADLRGRALAAGTDGSAAALPIKKGVKLVFVAAANVEQADFLLAQRISSQKGWQDYLAKYPAAPHTDVAKSLLAGMYIEAGQQSLSAYQKTAAASAPSYADLKNAKAQLVQAQLLVSNSDGESKLGGDIKASLSALADKAGKELDAYNSAVTSASPGFVHLQKAKGLADAIGDIDPPFAALPKLLADIGKATKAFEAALTTAELAAGQKQWEDAIKASADVSYYIFPPTDPGYHFEINQPTS